MDAIWETSIVRVSVNRWRRTIGSELATPHGTISTYTSISRVGRPSDLYTASYLFMQFLETITYSRGSWINLNNFSLRCKWCKFLHLKLLLITLLFLLTNCRVVVRSSVLKFLNSLEMLFCNKWLWLRRLINVCCDRYCKRQRTMDNLLVEWWHDIHNNANAYKITEGFIQTNYVA